jgi:hypothetical protein
MSSRDADNADPQDFILRHFVPRTSNFPLQTSDFRFQTFIGAINYGYEAILPSTAMMLAGRLLSTTICVTGSSRTACRSPAPTAASIHRATRSCRAWCTGESAAASPSSAHFAGQLVAGRLATDTPGVLTLRETVLVEGSRGKTFSRRCAGRTTRRPRSIPQTTARSGTWATTSREARPRTRARLVRSPARLSLSVVGGSSG